MAKLEIKKNEKKFDFFTKETCNGLLFTFKTALEDKLVEQLDQFDLKISKAVDGKVTEKLVILNLKELDAYIFSNNAPLREKTFEINRTNDSVTDPAIYRLPFYFGTNEVLKNGEQLYVELHNRGYKAGDNAERLDVTIETIPSIGLKEFKWFLEKIDIDQYKKEVDLLLGNDVFKVVYIPSEGEMADIKNIEISSDKLNADFTDDVIWNQLNNSYEPDTAYNNTPYDLINFGITLNDVKLNLQFGGASVGRSIIVARRILTPQLLNNIQMKSAEHQSENIDHVKKSAFTKCSC